MREGLSPSWALGSLICVLIAACGGDSTPADTADATSEVADPSGPPDTTDAAETNDTSDLEGFPGPGPDALAEVAAPDLTDLADPADLADLAGDPGPETLETSDVTADLGPDTEDAGPDTSPDVWEDTVPLAGFGAITGACGVIDDELYDPAPSLFVNGLDFADDPYDISDFELLTLHGQELILDGNAGGNSLYSEVFAMEMLARCELATLIASETEILYDVQGKITDILVEIDGERVGVSVVRAVGFPKDAPYTVAQATTILERKLGDILQSTANVSEEHRWVKQILHVLAYADQHADSVEAAWLQLPAEVRADTIVIVTVTHGDDLFMY